MMINARYERHDPDDDFFPLIRTWVGQPPDLGRTPIRMCEIVSHVRDGQWRRIRNDVICILLCLATLRYNPAIGVSVCLP